MSILSQFPSGSGSSGGGGGGDSSNGISLGNVHDIGISASIDQLSLTWSDPDDLLLGDETIAAWSKTTLIYKQGTTPPATLADGVLVVENTVRNQYAETPFVLSGLTPKTDYAFSWFVETVDKQGRVIADQRRIATTPGTLTPLSVARYKLAATTVGDYALFSGGVGGGATSAVVDAYDVSLARSTPTPLSVARSEITATTINDYALFGGGWDSSAASAVVDAYSSNLTRSTPIVLSAARYRLVATTVGNYALFGGGIVISQMFNVVDAYDSTLTRTTPAALSAARYALAAATIGNYALFAGGGASTDITYSSLATVDTYDEVLTRSTANALSSDRNGLAATTVGDYALFGGGYRKSYNITGAVNAYDKTLTRSNPTNLKTARMYLSATSAGGFAFFGGGGKDSRSNSSFSSLCTVDVYDTVLTRSDSNDLSIGRQEFAATSVGGYALFGGGENRDSGKSTILGTVDAYKKIN